MTVKMSYNEFKKKNREKQIICVDCGVAKHRLGALIGQKCSEKQGIGHFVPALIFFPVFFSETNRTYLTDVCAKGGGLKRPGGFIFVVTVDFW